MEYKVKFFESISIAKIEERVNEFLSKGNVELISFKQADTDDYYCFCLVYKEVSKRNEYERC